MLSTLLSQESNNWLHYSKKKNNNPSTTNEQEDLDGKRMASELILGEEF